jgi:CelD/BcsL family acetyltransferase involved in cellulose biosynthesis
MTLSVHSYHDANGFESLAGDWNSLLRRSAADTIFLTLEFQRTWWQHLGEGELLILAIRDSTSGDGELVAIAPFFLTNNSQGQRVLSTVGCQEVADYLDLIVATGHEKRSYAALVDYLASPSAPAWDVLDLCNIHQDSPTLDMLPGLAKAQGWTTSTAKDDVCPVVQLPETWEEYLEMLEGKQRREIRRKLRRASSSEDWYIVGPDQDLEAEIEGFLDLMAASTPDKADFLSPRMRGFFRHLARIMYDAGWLQLVFLTVGKRKAAAYLNFIYDNRVLVYNSGLDWQAFPRLGAGIILTAHCIRHAIEHGRQVFDFMQGDERYKYQFGGQDVEVRRLLIERT